MQPFVCQHSHKPPESYGDCVSACINTMLGRTDTPHVFDTRPAEESWAALRAWLKTIGRTLVVLGVAEDPRPMMKESNPDIPYILICRCRGEDHAIVCINDKMYHNPSWTPYEPSGPTENGWGIAIIGVAL
jgi:hypothetical protein